MRTLEAAEPVGVCHEVSFDVGGVMVKLPVFVVQHFKRRFNSRSTMGTGSTGAIYQ